MTKKRNMVLVLCLVLVTALVSVGGTIAWITARTASVKNTFTVGDINISLAETTTEYKMVPGNDISKNPKITVAKDSEASWLFVEITESANFDDYMTYGVDSGWTLLSQNESDGETEDVYVYYRKVNATTTEAVAFDVLEGNKVTVKPTVTKTQLEAVKTTNRPTLTFTAYAVQQAHITEVADAWTQAQTAVAPPVTE